MAYRTFIECPECQLIVTDHTKGNEQKLKPSAMHNVMKAHFKSSHSGLDVPETITWKSCKAPGGWLGNNHPDQL